MSDLISREAVIKAMENNSFMVEAFGTKRKMIDGMMMCVEIADLPTVEAKEVVHGYVKTVVGEMGVMHQECSVCGNALEWKAYPNYCDECGAKLDGADMRTSAE